ncbi:MAG: oligosaccharide flippase family protein, partial [Leptolyngbyaceae cyanobacterium bins.302]|nr:oligosaccharide flippase family protein [Leptolyngbyaceae cyanobacterium bins.302]
PPIEQKPSLLQRVIRGSAWTIGGHTANQIIRLGSNLLLTRLLFPEAFGLMALVFTFITGLHMLSDFGVQQSIIQNKRGDDPKFLNTAWTLNIVRGFALWAGACLIAFPVSQFYKEPILMALLPVVGASSIIEGFVSTKWTTSNRKLDLRRITTLDLTMQTVGVVVMLVLAILAKYFNAPKDLAIWALAMGSLSSSLTRLALSHLCLEGEKNHFEWDKTALAEISSFGRWIFLSTLLTFFAMNASNLIVPRLLGVAFFGIFSVSQSLSRLATEIVSTLGSRVLFPSYSELVRDRPERLYPVLKRSRKVLNIITVCICVIFIAFGKPLIGIMYDPRYADAGWILQILALGSMVATPGTTYGNVLLAQGKTFVMTALMGVQTVIQFACIFVGHWLGGEAGVMIGVAASGWLLYPFQAICYARLRLWQPEVDLPVIALASGLATLVYFRLI